MRAAKGYVTADGTFYETANEAELHEAHADLTKAAEEHGFRPESVVEICLQFPTNIVRFINAYYAPQASASTPNAERKAISSKEDEHGNKFVVGDDGTEYQVWTSPISQANKDKRRTKEATPPIQQQPSSSSQSVSDLRGRIQSEALRTNSPVDGVGMRGSYARSLRGSTAMSTALQTELAETFRQRREAYLRGEALANDIDDSE